MLNHRNRIPATSSLRNPASDCAGDELRLESTRLIDIMMAHWKKHPHTSIAIITLGVALGVITGISLYPVAILATLNAGIITVSPLVAIAISIAAGLAVTCLVPTAAHYLQLRNTSTLHPNIHINPFNQHTTPGYLVTAQPIVPTKIKSTHEQPPSLYTRSS